MATSSTQEAATEIAASRLAKESTDQSQLDFSNNNIPTRLSQLVVNKKTKKNEKPDADAGGDSAVVDGEGGVLKSFGQLAPDSGDGAVDLGDDYQLRPQDVLCGMGAGVRTAASHTGNLRMRVLLELRLPRFQRTPSSRLDVKIDLVKEVVQAIQESGGSFVKYVDGNWIRVSHARALDLVAHFLRRLAQARAEEGTAVAAARVKRAASWSPAALEQQQQQYFHHHHQRRSSASSTSDDSSSCASISTVSTWNGPTTTNRMSPLLPVTMPPPNARRSPPTLARGRISHVLLPRQRYQPNYAAMFGKAAPAASHP